MELQQFITKSLVEITNGIKEANVQIDKNHANFVLEPFRRDSKNGYIVFDIGVTASEKESSGGGGGIKIHVFEANIRGENKTVSENVSRIQFSIMPAAHIG